MWFFFPNERDSAVWTQGVVTCVEACCAYECTASATVFVIIFTHIKPLVRMGRTLTLDLGWNLAALLMKIHICSVCSFRPKYLGRLNIFFICLRT